MAMSGDSLIIKQLKTVVSGRGKFPNTPGVNLTKIESKFTKGMERFGI